MRNKCSCLLLALAFVLPCAAQSELETLRQQVAAQQKQIQLLQQTLVVQQKMLEELSAAQSKTSAPAQPKPAERAKQQEQTPAGRVQLATLRQEPGMIGSAASASLGSKNAMTSRSDEKDSGLLKRIDALEGRINRIGPFSFSGDFRLRDEPFLGGPANQSQVRNRERLRLRFNAAVKLNSDISGGFSASSGDINDPISTNQTTNQFFTRKPFLINQAFISYHPHQFKPLTLTGGKFGYPWYRTELTWDNDLNPEGVAEKLEWKSENWKGLRQFALVGFQLPFGEVAGVNFNFPNGNDRSIHQSVVYGGQIQTGWQLGKWVKVTADTAFYNYHNPDPIALSVATANSASPANGALKLGGFSFQNSYQIVTVATPVCLPPACATTTNANSSIVNAKLNSKFALWDSILQFDIKTHYDPWPVRILADYVQNTRACGNAGTPIFVPSLASGATATISTVNGACDSRQRRGYWLEGRFGRGQKKGDWQFAYTRMFIEREAVMSAFNFSDLRQNSNVSQHRLEVFYQALNNVQFGFTGLFGRPLNFGNSAPPENLLKRLQFDVAYKF
jgi:hypothetical protein